MAYFPPTGSVVAYQGLPSSMLVGASIIGLTPVTAVITGNPSISGTINIGTIPGSVVAFQGGTQVTSLVSTVPSSVIVGTSIFGMLPAGTQLLGSVTTLQGTNPWIVTFSNSSIFSTQKGTMVSSLVSTIPSSVLVGSSIFGQLPAGTAVLGSVATLQGTSPWNIAGSVAAVITNTPSVSGTVNVNQAGTWNVSIVGTMAGTSSVYQVLSSISTVSIMNALANRKAGTIFNSAGTVVFIKLGTAATTSVYTVSMNPNDYYELPGGWTGVVAGITNSTAGVIQVTELS